MGGLQDCSFITTSHAWCNYFSLLTKYSCLTDHRNDIKYGLLSLLCLDIYVIKYFLCLWCLWGCNKLKWCMLGAEPFLMTMTVLGPLVISTCSSSPLPVPVSLDPTRQQKKRWLNILHRNNLVRHPCKWSTVFILSYGNFSFVALTNLNQIKWCNFTLLLLIQSLQHLAENLCKLQVVCGWWGGGGCVMVCVRAWPWWFIRAIPSK